MYVDVLLLVFVVRFPVVEVVEVGDYYGHGQRDGQHAGDRAQRPDELAPRTYGHHVSVTDRCHRYNGPSERVRNAVEVRVLVFGLGEKDGAGEENYADEEEEDEQSELAHARFDRLPEDLQPIGVARQLEDSEDAYEPNDAKNGQRHGLVV